MLNLEMRKYIECSNEEKLTCLPLIEEIAGLAQKARNEGVLSLEDLIPDIGDYLLKTGLSLLVDGAETEILKGVLGDLIVTSDKTGVDLLRQMIIRDGVLALEAGLRPEIIQIKLTAMLGEDVGVGIKRAVYTGGPGAVLKEVEAANIMESGLEDLLVLNAYGVQTVLRKVDRACLLIVLSRASNDIRRTVLTSLSRNAAGMMCEDLARSGAFCEKDIEEARKKVAGTVVGLLEEGYIVIEGECKARRYAC